MTVCIAALCSNRNKIVAVSDMKAAYQEFSADDVLLKSSRLAPNWYALFAGDDITGVDFILARAKAKLGTTLALTSELVSRAVHDAIRERLREEIESQILSRFGLTLQGFLDTGRERFTERTFDDLTDRILKVGIPAQFIVAGFDRDGSGHLICVDGDQAPQSHDAVGYCAIGSGSFAAMSTLAFHLSQKHFSSYWVLESCLYCCCDAKFMAESASDVGKGTFLSVFECDKPTKFVSTMRIDAEIRREWSNRGAPRMPSSLEGMIRDMLCDTDDLGKPNGFEKFFGKRHGKKEPYLVAEFDALKRAVFYDPTTPGGLADPQSTKADPSPLPPSPESPGGSDGS